MISGLPPAPHLSVPAQPGVTLPPVTSTSPRRGVEVPSQSSPDTASQKTLFKAHELRHKNHTCYRRWVSLIKLSMTYLHPLDREEWQIRDQGRYASTQQLLVLASHVFGWCGLR